MPSLVLLVDKAVCRLEVTVVNAGRMNVIKASGEMCVCVCVESQWTSIKDLDGSAFVGAGLKRQ